MMLAIPPEPSWLLVILVSIASLMTGFVFGLLTRGLCAQLKDDEQSAWDRETRQ